MKREQLSEILSHIDDRQIAEAFQFDPDRCGGAPERILPMKKKRLISIALAAALILALGVSAYAVFGTRFVVSHDLPETGEYTSLSQLKEIEKTVGFGMTVPESFSNGFAFSRLTVRGEAIVNETEEVEREYYGVHVDYARPGSPERYLDLDPALGEAQPEPDERRVIDGFSVSLSLDHYKFVPEDYQKTEEDRAREAAGHYFITFGADSVSECDVAFAFFELDGAVYTLSDMAATEATLDELARMAAELIAAAA